MNWQGFLDKARSNLRVAERAYADGEPDPCVSRAYYAVFHAALAALLKLTDYRQQGQTWNHGNVAAEFSRRLIGQRKLFKSDLGQTLADLRTRRHRADYDSETVGSKIAGQGLKRAREFVEDVVDKLGSQV
jgi:uncharacterized protein (UPF0332 family)